MKEANDMKKSINTVMTTKIKNIKTANTLYSKEFQYSASGRTNTNPVKKITLLTRLFNKAVNRVS